MNIAIIGYGKMGKTIEKIAEDRGHQIVLKISSSNITAFTKENLVKHKVDLFHGLSQEIPKRKGGKLKYVVTIHDLIFLRHPETYKAVDRKIYDKKFRYAAKESDLIIAISEQTKQDLLEFYQADESKIRVVYQSCHDQFKTEIDKESRQTILEKYKLPSDYILYVGTLEQRKNFATLVRAAAGLDIPIVAVGRKTNYQSTIDQAAKDGGMEHKVIYLEGIPFSDLPAIYQSATVFCYPSIFEGFGIPIIEALYSKVPVITSAGGVFPEAGGEHSYYVDPLNSDEMAHQLKTCIDHKDLNRTEQAHQWVQRFSSDNFVDGVRNVYNELL